jgi:hypothetical protein
VAVVLILNAASVTVSWLLPGPVAKAMVLLLVLGFAGIAIQVTSPASRRVI